MTGVMNIRIQVMANQARRAIQQVQGDLTRMAGAAAAGGARSGQLANGIGAMGRTLTKMGSQLQWTGRQLSYNFTLPLVLAGGAATKWALDNEKAMTRVVKVYGDATMSTQQITNETNALGKAFEFLSEKYGIVQSQTIDIAADWAAAGSSGVALAKQVDLTMKTIVLGEMDAADATKALIAIQAQYNFSADELADTVARLNNVENQTGTTMGDLIDAMSRSAGVARAAGVDVAHLAAMTAALVPAAGTASQAGNALKTIISRLLSPTNEARDILEAMGIGVADLSWKSADAATRLTILSKKFESLSDAQKGVVSATLASRFQINKFEVLMDAIANKASYYYKALDAATNRTQYLRQAQYELNKVLDSSPKKFDRIKVMLQNSLADAIQPLLPSLIAIAATIADLAKKFSQLDPNTQKTIASFLFFLAVIGPIVSKLGALILLFGTLARAVGFLLKPLFMLAGALWTVLAPLLSPAWLALKAALAPIGVALKGLVGVVAGALAAVINVILAAGTLIARALLNPYVLALAAIVLLIWHFRDDIAKVFKTIFKFFGDVGKAIGDAFMALPKAIAGALRAVVQLIANTAKQVYEWFSYLNPFAHHSPSLVENVTKGMAAVRAQFGTLVQIRGPIDAAYVSIKRFKLAAADLAKGYDSIRTAMEVADLQKADASPELISSYVSLANQVAALKDRASQLNDVIRNQTRLVKNLQDALDNANNALDAQKKILDDLQKTADSYKDQISDLKDDLSNLASAPLQGMKAFDDAIFANTMAQKKLQLQMALMAQQGGMSIDDLKNKMASLNGEIETLTSQKQDARAMGAGSEILSHYDDQIKALQDQKKQIGTATNEVDKMQKELDKLQQQADIMDLQKSLKFDPLTRAIDQAANSMEELPFDQVMAGIKKDKDALAQLTPKYDQVNQAINNQQKAVDSAQAAVDSIQASYDAEKDKLDALKDVYDEVTQAISDMTQAMQDAAQAAQSLNQANDAMSPALKNFNDAAGGNFPDVSGSGLLGREGGAGDQSDAIDAWLKDQQSKMGDAFKGLDMFKPFKDLWNGFKKWLSTDVVGFFTGIPGLIASGLSAAWDAVTGFFSDAAKQISDFFSGPWGIAQWAVISLATVITVILLPAFVRMMIQGITSFASMVAAQAISVAESIALFAMYAAEWVAAGFKATINAAKIVAAWVMQQLAAYKSIAETLILMGMYAAEWVAMAAKATWGAARTAAAWLLQKTSALGSIATFAVAVATTVAGWVLMGVQALINAAKVAAAWLIALGPVGLIIAAVLAVVAVFVIFWDQIKAGMMWLWDNVLKPVFQWIWDGLKWVGDQFVWLWDNAVKPVLGWIEDGWNALMSAMEWVWENILKPVWNAIEAAANWLWNNVIKPVFGFILAYYEAIFTAMGWAWDHILKPVWNAIETAAQWLWSNILKPVFDAIGSAWEAMSSGFKWVWEHILKPVFDFFSGVIDALKQGFQSAVDGIGRIWDTLKSILMTPVQWVIDFVWNNGLRKLWNWINNLWGGDDIAPFKIDGLATGGVWDHKADGGVLSGYTPGRDVHRFFSPTGGILDLSGGEAVMRPEFTRALGRGWIDGANLAARTGGTTGVLDFLASSMGLPIQGHKRGGIIDLPGWLKWPLKFIPGGSFVTDIIEKMNSGDGFGGGGFGDMLWGMVKNGASKVWDAIKDWFLGSESSGTGGGGSGTPGMGSDEIKAFLRATDPKPYIWGAVGPNGYDCSGLAGQVWAMMTGHPQFRRYFTTGSIGNGTQFGFKPGLGGTLNLGFNDHHVVGEYGGLGFEAQSTATGILIGSKATPPSRMPKKMHMATGGVLGNSQLAKLLREGIVIGGDPSNPVFGPSLFGKQDEAARKMGLFDLGGLMRSGSLAVNLSGSAERVLSPQQTSNFERLVNVLDRVDFVALDARLNGSQTAAQPVVYNYNGDTVTININGDLSFPGINNGSDAQTFLRNLSDMAGGSKR